MIDIKDIIPFMRKGWVAMDKDGEWWWYSKKPYACEVQWRSDVGCNVGMIDKNSFDVKPVKDWTKSLIKVENK